MLLHAMLCMQRLMQRMQLLQSGGAAVTRQEVKLISKTRRGRKKARRSEQEEGSNGRIRDSFFVEEGDLADCCC
jgi:hypothetical protein